MHDCFLYEHLNFRFTLSQLACYKTGWLQAEFERSLLLSVTENCNMNAISLMMKCECPQDSFFQNRLPSATDKLLKNEIKVLMMVSNNAIIALE